MLQDPCNCSGKHVLQCIHYTISKQFQLCFRKAPGLRQSSMGQEFQCKMSQACLKVIWEAAYIAEVQIILLCIVLRAAHYKPAAWSSAIYHTAVACRQQAILLHASTQS